MNIKKNFIRNNIIVSLILLTTFLVIFFTKLFKIDDVNHLYFEVSYVIAGLSLLQVIVFLIYFFGKIKSTNYKKILSLVILIVIVFIEVKLLLIMMGAFLGDM